VLDSFKNKEIGVLVATDIAARIDIDQLPYVINFDLPNIPRHMCIVLVERDGQMRNSYLVL
jgi:superfamily II DNA/RNA helicase